MGRRTRQLGGMEKLAPKVQRETDDLDDDGEQKFRTDNGSETELRNSILTNSSLTQKPYCVKKQTCSPKQSMVQALCYCKFLPVVGNNGAGYILCAANYQF